MLSRVPGPIDSATGKASAPQPSRMQRWLVDSTALPHYADFMNLHVPPELEAKLDRLAAATGRRPISSRWTCSRVRLTTTIGFAKRSRKVGSRLGRPAAGP